MKHTSLVLGLILLCSGCSFQIGGDVSARNYFVLREHEAEPLAHVVPRTETLGIKDVTVNRFINSLRILFTDDPSQRHYYQFASWVDTPPRFCISILIAKLEQSKVFSAASRDRDGIADDLKLNIELVEFYHNTRKPPGSAEVSLRAELIDNRDHRMVGKRLFERSVRLTDYEAAGAVAGLEDGLNQVLDDVVRWLDEIAPRESASPPASVSKREKHQIQASEGKQQSGDT